MEPSQDKAATTIDAALRHLKGMSWADIKEISFKPGVVMFSLKDSEIFVKTPAQADVEHLMIRSYFRFRRSA
jgi:hypothetical protein